jgi:hypothetical protein
MSPRISIRHIKGRSQRSALFVFPRVAPVSNPWQRSKSWIASSQALLAMTLIGRGVTPHSRDTLRPRFANSFAPKKRGRREDRVRAAPAVSCARVDTKTHMSIQVQRKHSGLPCAMALRLIACSPRRDHSLFVTVAPRKRELPENLTPAIGASGPHDFAVRFTRCSSKAHRRPPLPAPTSVTMANAPSLGTGWRAISR